MALFSMLLTVFLFQQVYSPAEFNQVAGSSLKARYDSAISQGQRNSDNTFWVAYRLPLRPGLRVTTWDSNVSISSTTTSDGIEWIPDDHEVQRVAVFLLIAKSDAAIQRARLINLNTNFRVHDRKVYWLGEPGASESLSLLTSFATTTPNKSASSLIHYITLHDSADVVARLLQLARSSSNSLDIRRSAILALGDRINVNTGAELEKLTSDPSTDIELQAVLAISRRPDNEAIPSLIRIAKDHQNASVRRRAVQMLAQKKDPRVVDFFEEILKKK